MNHMPSGSRYSDAHLSKIDLSPEYSVKLNEWVSNPKRMLVLIGNPGIGKTYFCAAVANYLVETNSRRSIYMTEREFLSHLRSRIGDSNFDYSYEIQKMAAYESAPGKRVVWMFDDLGTSQMTDWQKEVLHTFLDELYKNSTPAIITSNIWLKDMDSTFNPRFRSRLSAKENVVIEINGQDKRELGL